MHTLSLHDALPIYTHIKAHSDIDILTIHKGFHTVESPLVASYPYKGNPVKELLDLRNASYELLRKAYPTAVVDNSGAKSISLKGGSLRRNIDVVPSNWFNTVMYHETKLDYHRGVMVLDIKQMTRISNTPFYHNKLLEVKDRGTANNYKRMVRLLKTLKADSEVNINLSSYDIAGLMYHMEDGKYLFSNSPIRLLTNSIEYLKKVYEEDNMRKSLLVPDGSRAIFKEGGASKKILA